MEIAHRYAIRRHFKNELKIDGTIVIYTLNSDYSLGASVWQMPFQGNKDQLQTYIKAINYASYIANEDRKVENQAKRRTKKKAAP